MVAQLSMDLQAPDEIRPLCSCGCGERPKGAKSRFLPGHDNYVPRPDPRPRRDRYDYGTTRINGETVVARRGPDGRLERRTPGGGPGSARGASWVPCGALADARFVVLRAGVKS